VSDDEEKATALAAQARPVIELLAETWPQAFTVYERRRKPLKIGIYDDILAQAVGGITATELAIALRRYAGAPGYLWGCRPGATRVGLDGSAAGVVTAEAAVRAFDRFREYLARKKRREAARKIEAKAPPDSAIPAPVGKPAGPKRLSLSDLRAAAQARKAAAA
jgi:ProP effector